MCNWSRQAGQWPVGQRVFQIAIVMFSASSRRSIHCSRVGATSRVEQEDYWSFPQSCEGCPSDQTVSVRSASIEQQPKKKKEKKIRISFGRFLSVIYVHCVQIAIVHGVWAD